MERIKEKPAIKYGTTNITEKGTVSIRKKGNSYEARIRLELKDKLKGVDTNPRLSRSGLTAEIAKCRLAELIIEKYFMPQDISLSSDSVFSEDCEANLETFKEYKKVKNDYLIHKGVHSNIDFGSFGMLWLKYKSSEPDPSSGKLISPKTVETYAYTLKKHVVKNFSKYKVEEMSKEIIEKYVKDLRKVYPRAAKDVFLMIRQILTYAKKKGLIDELPEFEIKFPKKKRSKKTKLVYIKSERQNLWLDLFEKDGRSFCKLFATLLQTGMRPEERLWS